MLTVTAAILTAMIIPAFINDTDSMAYGDGSVRQGKYIMSTGAYDRAIDLIYVINIETQKLCVYAPNFNKRTIDKMGTAIPLKPSTTTTRR